MLRIGDAVHVVTDNIRPFCQAGWVSQIEVDAEDMDRVRVAWLDRLAENPGPDDPEEPPPVVRQDVATYDREGRDEPPTWHYPDHDGEAPPENGAGDPAGSD
jgi:hypothetical protein